MSIKNPLYDESGQFLYDKLFSYFGVPIALLAFLATGLFFETVGNALWPIDVALASQSHLFVIGGTLGFAIVTIMIYGFAGFVVLCLMWLVGMFIDQWPLAVGAFLGGFVGISISSQKTPYFHTTFMRWVRSREQRGQKRVM